MRAGTIARIYAETLLRLAQREDALEPVDEGARLLAAVLVEDEQLARFLAAPQIAAEHKRDVVGRALGGRIHPALVRFLHLVIDKRREPMLGEILDAWRQLIEERAGRVTATVVTATEIDDPTREAYRVALEGATGKHVTLEQSVDPRLIGGVVLRFGDTVVDGSVRRRLDTLRHMLRTAHV